MSSKDFVKDIIGILIVLAAIVSIWWTPTSAEFANWFRVLAGAVIGYYFGIKALPLGRKKISA